MIATLWLLTITLITASECVYAPPPLVKFRRLEDNTPLGNQDDSIAGKRSFSTLSVMHPIDTLRKALLLQAARRQATERREQVERNRQYFKDKGKRSNERHTPIEREYYEPYQQHPKLDTLIEALADAASQANYQYIPIDTIFDENDGIESESEIPVQNMHFNIVDGDAQNDRFIDLDDEQAWRYDKQPQRFNQLQKQQRLNERNKNILRQWDNKQLDDRTQVPPTPTAPPPPPSQAKHQHQQNQQQQQLQKQRQQDNSQHLIKPFDNGEHFMLRTFDSN